jgi:hypothetical protein
MAKIAIVMKSDLSIASWYEAASPNQGAYGGPWGREAESSHIACPEGLDWEVAKAQEDGEGGIELVADSAKEDAKEERLWAALRSERNAKLSACDWTQVADAPLTTEKKAEWAAYRQDLRDLPEETADPASPSWPAEPSA